MMSKYSNGWGHLVISLAVIGMVTYLLATKSLDATACTTLLSIVITFWFASGMANRFNAPVQSSLTPAEAASPLPPISTGTSTTSTGHGG